MRRLRRAGRGGQEPTRCAESGQISIYILGLTIVAMMLIVVTYGITSVALARVRLMDAADSAALAAANAFDAGTYTDRGIQDTVPLSDATVRQAAAESLAAQSVPPTFLGWWVEGGTGTPDGRTAVVVVSARIRIPLAAAVIGERASLPLTVESRARAATR